MVEAIIWGGVLLALAVLIVVEWRIMRKPNSQRSERERRFLAADRKFARGYNKVAMKIVPIVEVVLGIGLMLFAIPFWSTGETGLATTLTVIGALSVAAGIAFAIFFKKRRGADFWARQEVANVQADQKGHPRWFGSTRAAVVFGVMLIVMGAAFLGLNLMAGNDDLLVGRIGPIVLIVGGVACIAAARAQVRREGHQ